MTSYTAVSLLEHPPCPPPHPPFQFFFTRTYTFTPFHTTHMIVKDFLPVTSFEITLITVPFNLLKRMHALCKKVEKEIVRWRSNTIMRMPFLCRP